MIINKINKYYCINSYRLSSIYLNYLKILEQRNKNQKVYE